MSDGIGPHEFRILTRCVDTFVPVYGILQDEARGLSMTEWVDLLHQLLTEVSFSHFRERISREYWKETVW